MASIPLFGGLTRREESRNRRGQRSRSKMTIEWKSDDLFLHAEDSEIAGTIAEAITDTIRVNMLTGRAPDGQALPGVSPATAKRRAQRVEQAARGGEPHGRWTSEKVKRIIRKNWKRRYSAQRLGDFVPGNHGGNRWFGVESGMLAWSALAVPEGRSWIVFFANPRGVIEPGGSSAVARVFSRLGMGMSLWSQRAMQQPKMQAVMREIAESVFVKRSQLGRSQLGKSLKRLASTARATSQEIDQTGELE